MKHDTLGECMSPFMVQLGSTSSNRARFYDTSSEWICESLTFLLNDVHDKWMHVVIVTSLPVDLYIIGQCRWRRNLSFINVLCFSSTLKY